MNYVVEVSGRKHTVKLPDALVDGQELRLVIDAATYTVTWLSGPAVLVLRDGQGVERLLRLRDQRVEHFDGDAAAAISVDVLARGQVTYLRASVHPDAPGQDARAKAVGSREQVVRSLITGKVLKVLVKPGDRIDAGQTLLIVEAMKMENRIFAQAGGTVQAVAVAEGDAVQTGKELARIAP